MAIALSLVFLSLSLYFIATFNGLMSAFFLVLSLVAFINHTGGGKGPDDNRYA